MSRRLLPLLPVALLIAACSPNGASSAPTSAAVLPTTPPTSSEAPSAPSMSTGPSMSANDVTVTALEYAFIGLPDSPWTGMNLHFQNAGKEAHEMIVVRKNANVTTSMDDLMKDPMKALSSVTVVGVASADPGQTSTTVVTLDQAGDYALLDLTPSGSTTAPSASGLPSTSGGISIPGLPFPLPSFGALPSIGPGMSIPAGVPDIALGMVKIFTVADRVTPPPASSSGTGTGTESAAPSMSPAAS